MITEMEQQIKERRAHIQAIQAKYWQYFEVIDGRCSQVPDNSCSFSTVSYGTRGRLVRGDEWGNGDSGCWVVV